MRLNNLPSAPQQWRWELHSDALGPELTPVTPACTGLSEPGGLRAGHGEADLALGPFPGIYFFLCHPDGSHTARPFLKGNSLGAASVMWVQKCHRFCRARPTLRHPTLSKLITSFSHSVGPKQLCGSLTGCRELSDCSGWLEGGCEPAGTTRNSFARTRPPSSPKARLICLFICLLISNSTLLRNNFRKRIFQKFHLAVSFAPTSFWVKPPECREGVASLVASAQSLLAADALLLRGGGGRGPVSSYICAPQGATRFVTQLAAGADFGLGAREAHVYGWEPGPSALEAACLGRRRFSAMLTLTETVRKEDAEARPCLVGGRSPPGEADALNRWPHPGGSWCGKRGAQAGSPGKDPLILVEGAVSLGLTPFSVRGGA